MGFWPFSTKPVPKSGWAKVRTAHRAHIATRTLQKLRLNRVRQELEVTLTTLNLKKPLEMLDTRSAFVLFACLAAIMLLWNTFLVFPIKILALLFHELSHGLAAWVHRRRSQMFTTRLPLPTYRPLATGHGPTLSSRRPLVGRSWGSNSSSQRAASATSVEVPIRYTYRLTNFLHSSLPCFLATGTYIPPIVSLLTAYFSPTH